jgi:phage/plasmid-associated DNA primase
MRRDGRAVECDGLENRYLAKTGSWVRIPLSPPDFAKAPVYVAMQLRRAYVVWCQPDEAESETRLTPFSFKVENISVEKGRLDCFNLEN